MHITELTAFHKLKKKKNEGPLLSSFYEASNYLDMKDFIRILKTSISQNIMRKNKILMNKLNSSTKLVPRKV